MCVGRCFAVVVVAALFECCLCLFTRHYTLVRLLATRTTLALALPLFLASRPAADALTVIGCDAAACGWLWRVCEGFERVAFGGLCLTPG